MPVSNVFKRLGKTNSTKSDLNPIAPQFGSVNSPSFGQSPELDLENIKVNMKNNTEKYKEISEKYKQLQDINKQLTGKYVKNLEIILDVTKILNMYMETFDTIREELTKSSEIFSPLSVNDLSYIEHITSNSVKELTSTLLSEINKLESLLGKSKGFSKETEHLRSLRDSLSSPVSSPMFGTRTGGGKRNEKYRKSGPKKPCKGKKI